MSTVFWSASLTVDVDEGRGLFKPLVELRGRSSLERGTLRVELVDERGVVRRVVRRAFGGESLGGQLRMPSFTAPDGASPDEVLRWSWDVVVEEGSGELVRWRRYLEVSTRFDAEGEIVLAGPPEALRSKEEVDGRGPEARWDEHDSERLLTALVSEGLFTPEERDELLARYASTGRTVERILIERGRLSEHEVLRRLAELTGSEFVELAECPIDPQAAAIIPAHLARAFALTAIGFRGELLTVAMSDPQNQVALHGVNQLAGGEVYIVIATREDVFRVLEERGASGPWTA